MLTRLGRPWSGWPDHREGEAEEMPRTGPRAARTRNRRTPSGRLPAGAKPADSHSRSSRARGRRSASPCRSIPSSLLRRRRASRSGSRCATHVLRPGLAAVRPPGVLLGLAVQAAEHVDEAELVERAAKPGGSSGRKPEFFWLERQFFRSICWWAMFQSPPENDFLLSILQFFQVQKEILQKPEFGRWRCGLAEPEGR